MKFLLVTTLFLSLGVIAQSTYSPNDGNTPPGTFESKSIKPGASGNTHYKRTTTTTTSSVGDAAQAQEAGPAPSETGIKNSSGVTTDQMNTSPNKAPGNDEEALDNSTLSNGRFNPTKPAEVQAQEDEDALDYSTTPEKTVTPQKSNKKK
jgi:hypothetical protein